MLFNSYSYEILYEQFHWIYLQGDIKLSLVTVNNRLNLKSKSFTTYCVTLYKTSPIQRHQNRFCTPTPSWRDQAHNLWRSKAWWTNRQTDNKKLNVFGHPGGGWNPSPTKLGMVIGDRGPWARSCTPKLLEVWCTVSLQWGAENLGITRPRQLTVKPP